MNILSGKSRSAGSPSKARMSKWKWFFLLIPVLLLAFAPGWLADALVMLAKIHLAALLVTIVATFIFKGASLCFGALRAWQSRRQRHQNIGLPVDERVNTTSEAGDWHCELASTFSIGEKNETR